MTKSPWAIQMGFLSVGISDGVLVGVLSCLLLVQVASTGAKHIHVMIQLSIVSLQQSFTATWAQQSGRGAVRATTDESLCFVTLDGNIDTGVVGWSFVNADGGNFVVHSSIST